MDLALWTSLMLGFLLGIVHAFDPDHLVAVGTLAADSDNVRESSMLGVFWGIGHTLTLALVGSLVLVTETAIPSVVAEGMEGLVGIMIVVLGGRLLWCTLSRPLTVHSHVHRHESMTHRHFHIHDDEHRHRHHHAASTRSRALAVGMVHGLAGSAALSLVVMASMPTVLWGIVYIVVFGIGSIGGMLLMSMLLSLPFLFTSERWMQWHRTLKMSTALVAIGFGSYLAWTSLL